MKRWISAVVVFLVVSSLLPLDPAAVQAEEKRPITPEDIYQLRTPSSPVISPDGRWVAYQVTQMVEVGYLSYVGISSTDGAYEWLSRPFDLMPSWSPDGGELAYWSILDNSLSILHVEDMAMEKIDMSESPPLWSSAPQWSPNGHFISYISDGKLLLLDLNSKETRQIASINGSISSHVWSPIDDRIAFSGCGNLFLWEENETLQLTESEEVDKLAGWSPNGDYIAFSRGSFFEGIDGMFEGEPYNDTDIYVITPDGEEKQLTDQPGLEMDPLWSPDSNWLVYSYMDIDTLYWNEVWVVDLNGNKREITRDFERSSFKPFWSSNGDIYFRAENEGAEDVYEASLSGNLRRITEGEGEEIVFSNTMDVREDLIAYTSGDVYVPTEVYVYDLESETKKITHLNDDFVNEIELLEPLEFWFNASDGTPIQGWHLKPEGREKYPLIMVAHGGPHLSWVNTLFPYYSFDLQVLAAQGYGVAWINPRGSLGYDREFAEAIRGAWGINDSGDFLDGIDYLIEQGWVDENRLGFTGISYGGYMTNWMITHTDRFKAAVSDAGLSNLTRWYSTILDNFGDIGLDWALNGSPEENPDVYEKCSPITYVENVTTPTLFIHGVRDLNAAIEEAEEMVIGIIKNTDTSVALIRYPDEGHGILSTGENFIDRTDRMINWFDSYLKV